MNAISEDVQLDLLRESRAALDIINENNSKPTLLQEAKRISKERDAGRAFYDPYDSLAFEGKLRVDMMYFNQLFKKLDEGQTQKVEEAMTSFFKAVREIYEFVNIKPEIFGKNIDVDIIDESIDRAEQRITEVIHNNLDNNFYKLNQEQRKERYYDTSKHTIKTVMESGVEPDDAIKYGVKVAVLENLIRSISFPFACWSRVKHLTEDIDYGRVFEQDKLIEHVEDFEKKVYNLSKIVAVCV